MRWDWIWANPAAAANKPAAEPTEMRPPTPAQIHALLAHAAANPAFHLFLVLAATTGARRGELLALRWADIDLAQGSISIQRALVEGPTGPTLAPTKTRRPHHLELDTRTWHSYAPTTTGFTERHPARSSATASSSPPTPTVPTRGGRTG
jgi:integrase